MPRTKKESLHFGLMMCTGMVVVMTFYNMWLNGQLGELSFGTIVLEFLIGFVIALLLDLYTIGPLAKKVAFSLPFDKSNKLKVVLAISTCMVVGMAAMMSIFGLVMANLSHGMADVNIFQAYAMTFVKNFIVAYPLQLLIMGPLVRGLFTNFVQSNNTVKVETIQ
ncbi:DUF2798 domain-containing protein [Paraliobacillus ryukyuensis]|uniref:DUF2798 domain-containing protein n=1 Tax=Paraliobacillus ryukyuensis TaxID=200904 RepID=UPI0009A5D901|nr:DUF2798 domain-containing protein [Paraliobacillus ryukyuensis]